MNPSESTYGRIAAIAARKAAQGMDARLAWEATADKDLRHSRTAARKSCPKLAFLGLVDAGQVAGVTGDSNREPGANGGYALMALDLLRHDPSNNSNPTALWRKVMEIQGFDKKHNSQMHVVTALWNDRLFVGQST
jgi:hypothetical protein